MLPQLSISPVWQRSPLTPPLSVIVARKRVENGCVGSCQSVSPLGQGSPLAPPFSVTVASKRVEQGCCQSCQSTYPVRQGSPLAPSFSVPIGSTKRKQQKVEVWLKMSVNNSSEVLESFSSTLQWGMWAGPKALPINITSEEVESFGLTHQCHHHHKESAGCGRGQRLCPSTYPVRNWSALAPPLPPKKSGVWVWPELLFDISSEAPESFGPHLPLERGWVGVATDASQHLQ